MIKKYILGCLLALSVPMLSVLAATPLLTTTASGDGNAVTVNVSGAEPRAPVVLYFNSSTYGTPQSTTIGTTDDSGRFSGSVNTRTWAIGSSAPVYVLVDGYQSGSVTWPYNINASSSTSAVFFNQSNPSLSVGGNGTVTLSGGTGSYYIASNSNTGAVGTSISGNTLTLSGMGNGQANIMVCSTGGGCGTFATTIGASGSPSVNQSMVTFNQGGQGSVTLSGGSAPYTVSIPNGSGISTTMVGNTLYINGSMMGSNTVNVCSSNGACTPVTVNVQAAGQTSTTPATTGTGGQIAFALPLSVGQALQLTLNGGVGNYYLQTPMSSPALASISGNSLMLSGQASGNGTVMVCQTGGSSCLPISITVSPALTGTGGGYFFETDLSVGSSGQDVMELQSRLRSEGFFTATPTGYYGPITQSAVMQYQTAHGISATGYLGPITRGELNK